ncbi:tRNA pseudouridine(55) synthase TruB [Dyella sp.]|uniref:tRNA pseudouridine(55) synthase TruB n=1 Tax=Dyella sp. TaxID=1869338 RepID=UPI002ED04801
MSRTIFRPLHGIVLLDKPLHMSSNQALQAARKLLRAEKGGHTGALDPLATGLLPLCLGEATKVAGTLLGSRKAYRAECRLGATTTTADLEGEIVQERLVPALDSERIEQALVKLRGRIVQIPPVYSALKQDGEPLYLKARRGEIVQAPPREVEVHRLDLLEHQGDRLTLYVECGSGTYVRSLAVDLGEALGCGAHLTSLRRLWVEPFREPAMITLDTLAGAVGQGEEALLACVRPIAEGLVDLRSLHLDAEQSLAVSQGRQIQVEPCLETTRHAVFADDGRLLVLADIGADGIMRIIRGFNLPLGGAIC